MTEPAQQSSAPFQIPAAFTLAMPAAEQYPVAVQQRAADLCAAADRAVVASTGGMEDGATLDKMIQAALKKGEEERTNLTGPLNAVVKLLNSKFKAVSDPLETARKTIQAKMLAYKQEQYRIAREAAEKARKEAEEAALKQAQALEAQGQTEQAAQVLEDAIEAPPPLLPTPAGPVRSEIGAVSSFVAEWKYRPADEEYPLGSQLLTLSDGKKVTVPLVPMKYLMLDDRKIREAIKGKDGLRNIAGLEIVNEPRIVTR